VVGSPLSIPFGKDRPRFSSFKTFNLINMMCTYLSSWEAEKFTTVSNPELNKLFQEVRDAFPGKFLLRELMIQRRRGFFTSWFVSAKEETMYELYGVLSLPEVQVINFCRDWEWSINSVVPKSYIMTYFYGLLVGRNLRIKNTCGATI
jgi:hypothetical protein